MSEKQQKTDGIYSFELLRPLSGVRSYVIKMPLKRSVKDIFSDLFTRK